MSKTDEMKKKIEGNVDIVTGKVQKAMGNTVEGTLTEAKGHMKKKVADAEETIRETKESTE